MSDERDIDDELEGLDGLDGALDPAELAEAAALARALERGTVPAELREVFPEDAFEAAGLVAYSRDGGALDDARLDAIFETVLAEARPREPEPEVPWWRRWILPLGFVGATAAALALVLVPSEAGLPSALPTPDVALLRAQAAAARGDEERRALDAAMGAYRGEVLAALGDRYGR